MMGMAMIMAAGTGMVAAGDTDGSKPLISLTEITTQAPFHVNLARIRERKPQPSDSVQAVFAEMTVTERAALREAILFLFFLLSLTFLVIVCMDRGLVRVMFTWRSI
ncbi:hypothetical protein SUGI_0681570 [Cryptomeria japonica]|nr:hypothetical protein SUGI_0681570 [Cryptomeria japonica]